MIVLAPENIQKQTVSSEVEERMKAGKKRAKKLRQKMSGRTMRERGEVLVPTVMTTGSRHNQRCRINKEGEGWSKERRGRGMRGEGGRGMRGGEGEGWVVKVSF